MRATPKEIAAAVNTLGCGLVRHFPASDTAREIIMMEIDRSGVSGGDLNRTIVRYIREIGEWTTLANFLSDLRESVRPEDAPGVADTLRMLDGQRLLAAPIDPEEDARLRAAVDALARKIHTDNVKRKQASRGIRYRAPEWLRSICGKD